MFLNWLPLACTRLRVFISYSSEQHEIAEEIAQALKNLGHFVFVDKESLPIGKDYNERIRKAIQVADRCIFLVTKSALQQGKYTLTELEFAKSRWSAPSGKVFPVIVDHDLKAGDLPPYLKSVQALVPRGNITAEVAAVLDQSRKLTSVCLWCTVLLGLGSLVLALWLTGFWHVNAVMPSIRAIPFSKVHFQPRAEPPMDPSRLDAPTSWTDSPVFVAPMPVAYSREDFGTGSVQLMGAEIELRLGARTYKYGWEYEVDIKDQRCSDWLCVKQNVRVTNLPQGITDLGTIMFSPRSNDPISWKSFIDQILGSDSLKEITVVMQSKIGLLGQPQTSVETECLINVLTARAAFLNVNRFKPGQDPRPIYWEPFCVGRE